MLCDKQRADMKRLSCKSFITANQSLPFYFVDPETGKIRLSATVH